jgi:hypothetical protein
MYDFWEDPVDWYSLNRCGLAIKRFLTEGNPGLMSVDAKADRDAANGDKTRMARILDQMHNEDLLELWRQLALLPRMYEDHCREFFLPTSLGYLSSFYHVSKEP